MMTSAEMAIGKISQKPESPYKEERVESFKPVFFRVTLKFFRAAIEKKGNLFTKFSK